jgi:hypothetical protein
MPLTLAYHGFRTRKTVRSFWNSQMPGWTERNLTTSFPDSHLESGQFPREVIALLLDTMMVGYYSAL